jgi:hypothetical protein
MFIEQVIKIYAMILTDLNREMYYIHNLLIMKIFGPLQVILTKEIYIKQKWEYFHHSTKENKNLAIKSVSKNVENRSFSELFLG